MKSKKISKSSQQIIQPKKSQKQELDQVENNQANDKNKNFKWILLFIAVFSATSGQIAFVFPAYFEIQLKELLEIGDLEYNLLFSIQSVPNIILPMLTGLMPQKFGLGRSIFMIMIITFTGHFSQFVSVYLRSYYMLMMARLLVGIGFVNYATLLVVQITNWFYGSQLGLASSIQMLSGKLSLAFSGFFFGFWQSSDPSQADNLYQPLFYLLILGGICLSMCILCINLDYTEEQREKERIQKIEQQKQEEKRQNNEFSVLQFFKNICDQIIQLNKLYWVILILGSMVNGIYYSYLNNVQEFLQEYYNITGTISGLAFFLPMLIAAIVSPFSGIVCDKSGNFRDLWFFGSFFILFPYLFIISGLRFDSDQFTALTPSILFGMFYGLVNVIRQPCIRYTVNENQYSFATGLSISYINIIMIVFPIIYGFLMEKGINVVVLFGFIYSITFMIGTVYLIFYDKKNDNMLVESSDQKDEVIENSNFDENNENIRSTKISQSWGDEDTLNESVFDK